MDRYQEESKEPTLTLVFVCGDILEGEEFEVQIGCVVTPSAPEVEKLYVSIAFRVFFEVFLQSVRFDLKLCINAEPTETHRARHSYARVEVGPRLLQKTEALRAALARSSLG